MELERILMRDVGRAVGEFDLIQEGDRILVAMSGGKDSYGLAVLLRMLQKRAPVRFDLLAVHLDQGHPGYDGGPLVRWLEQESFPYQVLHEDTFSIVTDKIPEGKTYCSLCSRLRRGILYRAATELGCNKIALGHHRDDVLETVLLNLFFEDRLAAFAQAHAFPILPCNLCGSQSEAQRKQMKRLLADLETKHPTLRQTMIAALGNVNPSHLLDRRLTNPAAAAAVSPNVSDPPERLIALTSLR
jgi:tRNA 2-thiocytidine biosynthesis protein TtcA